ncbi:AAA family ATPase [Archangium violaceum]|uniref:AAA family ATPase n=1 Tax=Archangium violaceum TaxID=83451 RepID=UPI002B2D3D0D|nr:AAA family ATPase [Archangium violaceum]
MKPKGMPSPRGAVPVPSIHPGTGNSFPEPSGTGGTGCPLFEPLAAFLERTRDLPPLSWLIEGVVPDSGNLLIVAAPGAGKTFLALVIAKTAAAEGRPSLLVLEEGRPRSMFDRFTALAFPPEAPVFIAHRKGVRLEDETIREQMAEFLRTHEAPVVVFDPFSSLFLGNENDTEAVNQAKEHVQRLATVNPRALVVLLHHTSKAGERGEGPPIYAARGSTVLPGWADMQVNLSREDTPRGAMRVAFVAQVAKGRDGETAQRYRFTISLGDGTVTIDDMSEAAAQDKAQEVRQVLASAATPLGKTKLAEMLTGRRQDSFRVIEAMEARGELKREGGGYILAPGTGTECEP